MLKEPDRSFVVIKDSNIFPEFHYHPEYELTYIIEGRGRRIVGDGVDKFMETDLVFLGRYLPHEYTCEPHFMKDNGEFQGKAIVIQFHHDFLGDSFFDLPENSELLRFLQLSAQGIQIFGKARKTIVDLMYDMLEVNNTQRLYLLFRIFDSLVRIKEYNFLSSPGFVDSYLNKGVTPIAKAGEYILQNFQKDIRVMDLLEITNMSNTTFCSEFKRHNGMNFKKYLTNVRIGYACRLLIRDESTISEVAYQSGFENLSNFNRQFKGVKGMTPHEYRINCHSESINYQKESFSDPKIL